MHVYGEVHVPQCMRVCIQGSVLFSRVDPRG